MKNQIISPEQCKVARTFLNWSQEDLAKKVKITKKTVADFERKATTPHARTIDDIYRIFCDSGIKLINDKKTLGVHLVKKDVKNIRIAQNNLIVFKAFLVGSDIDTLLSKEVDLNYLSYDWSDKMLDDLSNSKLDMIIYNTNRAKKFISDRYLDNIEILDHLCYSMGGENFFLLGKQEFWGKTSLEEFKEDIQKKGKAIIVTSKNSDNVDNLSLLLDLDDPKIKIINLPADNIRKEIFEINPHILVCGSQNSRYTLLYQDDIIEVLNCSSINDKAIKNKISSNSENSFIVNKKIYDLIPKEELLEIIKLSKINFHNLSKNKDEINNLVFNLLDLVRYITASDDNAEFIVRNILYKTYRIGSPL